MFHRLHFQRKKEIGVYGTLTNSYLLLAGDSTESYYNPYEKAVEDLIPVVRTTIGGCRAVGCLTAGNRYGLLLPDYTTETELQCLRNSLPDSVKICCVEDRLSALGNVITCNDHVALVHPDIDKETEQTVADALNVEVFRRSIANNPLVGSCALLSNNGGMLHPKTNAEELEELTALLQIPLETGTVNNGSELIAAGLMANDWTGFLGRWTTWDELLHCRSIFQLSYNNTNLIKANLKAEKLRENQSQEEGTKCNA